MFKIFLSRDPPHTSFTNTWIGRGSESGVTIGFLAYRWLLSLMVIAALIQSIFQNTVYFLNVGEDENVYKYFIYLTNNARLVAVLGFTLDAALVTRRFFNERNAYQVTKELEDGKVDTSLPLSYKLLWILTNINCSVSFVVTLVYWILLYTPERHYLDFENFSGHGMSLLFCLLDMIVTEKPWKLWHAVHPVGFGIIFGAFSLIYHLCGGTNYYFEPYIYPIIDWNRPGRTVGVMLGVSAALVVFHTFYFLLYKIKNMIKTNIQWKRNSPVLGDNLLKSVDI